MSISGPPGPFPASKVYYIMERVETLLKKLKEQFDQKAQPGQLLLTVQMLQAELLHLQGSFSADPVSNPVSVTVSQNISLPAVKPTDKIDVDRGAEDRTMEILQVDEAAVEAELEEIKRNADMMKMISIQNKPAFLFEMDEDIPTLPHRQPTRPSSATKEINESVVLNHSSVNEKLKQSRIDLGESLTDLPVRDLKKAIGVNDRFLFINELFRGDEVVYERSIKTINSFTILPEAEYWIQRELKVKNGWKDSDEVVKQFYQMVKRRFS